MKISVILPRYAITGVPLAQARFARALAARGHDVEFVIGYIDDEFEAPTVDGVKVTVWRQPTVRKMLLPLIRHLHIEKPNIVFSAEDHLNTMVLLAAVLSGSKAKISGSSRVTPFDTYSSKIFSKRWILKQAARALMWRADVLTCVSQDMVTQYRKVFSAPPHVCVYNIVDDRASRERILEPVDHPWIRDKSIPLVIGAGRLAPWKGFANLINAVAIISSRRRVRLLILGDGPLKLELQTLIERHNLNESIQLVGYVNNPLKYFANADVFALSSLVEGMPNVLVEAMMCGCTPVATDCPTGPRELLQGGKYGYLVPVGEPEALAAGIEQALDMPIPQSTLDLAVAAFEESTIINQHFELLGVCEK